MRKNNIQPYVKYILPRLFRRDRIYGVWQDEFDVQYVMRLRIVGDGPSA
jgi:hypothetical protein